VNEATLEKMEMGRSASALSVELSGISRVNLASQHMPYRHCDRANRERDAAPRAWLSGAGFR
jgi:hypothetical protein